MATNLSLMPHQIRGVEWLTATTRGGLFDDQGLGKTATAICAAREIGADRILVICPASVLFNWRKEFKLWDERRSVFVVQGAASIGDRAFDEADVVVVSMDTVKMPEVHATVASRPWDLVVVDEVHFFKSKDSKRAKALFGLSARMTIMPIVRCADRVWLMSGTPMPNDPSELWPMLYGCAPRLLIPAGHAQPMNFFQFRQRYCDLEQTRYGVKVLGVNNRTIDELREILARFSLRRRKSDELDLPPIRWGSVTLTSTSIPAELAEIEAQLPRDADGNVDLDELRSKTAEFSTWRRLSGIAKALPAAELICDELADSDEKLVVFFHHREVAEVLRKALTDAKHRFVTITGGMSARDRQDAVDTFQTDPSCRVALCNIVAGGTGTTLTAASNLMFVEQSFVPGENAQAADRIYRIGQQKSVLIRVLTLGGSVDENVSEALSRKTQMIQETIES